MCGVWFDSAFAPLYFVGLFKTWGIIDMCIHRFPLRVVKVVDLHVRAGAVVTATIDIASEEGLAEMIESCWEGEVASTS